MTPKECVVHSSVGVCARRALSCLFVVLGLLFVCFVLTSSLAQTASHTRSAHIYCMLSVKATARRTYAGQNQRLK